MKKATQELAAPKAKGRRLIPSKRHPLYPASAEREYQRTTNAYMRLLKQEIKNSLPEIKAAVQEETARSGRYDSDTEEQEKIKRAAVFFSFAVRIEELFDKIRRNVKKSALQFDLTSKLNRLSEQVRTMSSSEWQKTIRQTLGIDIFKDYYSGEFYKDIIPQWISDNVDLIKTIPEESLDRMKDIVLNDFREGRSVKRLTEDILEAYDISERHARFIARDQIGKLYGQITRKQQEDAGVSEYTWRTAGDERVRDGHKNLEKKTFRWDDPPVVEQKTGRRCHPGEDYQCRCVAIPVMDMDTITLPVNEKSAIGG